MANLKLSNNNGDSAGGIKLLKSTTDGRKALRGLSATAELYLSHLRVMTSK